MKSPQPKTRRRILSKTQSVRQSPRKPHASHAETQGKWGWKPAKIAELNAIIEAYGGDPDTFWRQQSHSYEAVVARKSLSELLRFYSLLFEPGATFEKIRENCPRWPKGSKMAGALPSIALLSEIRMRFAQDKAIGSHGHVMQFLERFKGKTQTAHSQDVLDSVIRMLTDEVVAAKLAGMPVSQQLKAIDRLLKRETQRISWTKVKTWLDSQVSIAIQALCEEAKSDPVAVEYLKKVQERIRDLHTKAEGEVK